MSTFQNKFFVQTNFHWKPRKTHEFLDGNWSIPLPTTNTKFSSTPISGKSNNSARIQESIQLEDELENFGFSSYLFTCFVGVVSLFFFGMLLVPFICFCCFHSRFCIYFWWKLNKLWFENYFAFCVVRSFVFLHGGGKWQYNFFCIF